VPAGFFAYTEMIARAAMPPSVQGLIMLEKRPRPVQAGSLEEINVAEFCFGKRRRQAGDQLSWQKGDDEFTVNFPADLFAAIVTLMVAVTLMEQL